MQWLMNFISERLILSLVLWRTIRTYRNFPWRSKPTYQSSLPSLIVPSSIYQGSCFVISNGSRWFPSKSEVETVLVPFIDNGFRQYIDEVPIRRRHNQGWKTWLISRFWMPGLIRRVRVVRQRTKERIHFQK